VNDPRLFLGIDGGGSGTRAIVINAAGGVVGRGEAGPSNPNQTGWDGVAAAVSAAVSATGVTGPFAGVHAGLAGVATAASRTRLGKIIADLGIADAASISTGHDLEIALAGGLSGRPGIVLVAGTGSACFGRNATGDTWQAGGWGPILDDVGGGYWLGLRAIMVAIRAEDGRGPSTNLGAAVLAATGAASLREVLAKLHDGSLSRPAVAALAPLVIDAALRRDKMALVIMALGAAELGLMVGAVAKKLGLADGTAEVVISGGAGRSQAYAPAIEAGVRKHVPKATFPKPELSAVAGAVILAAMRSSGVDLSAALRTAGC